VVDQGWASDRRYGPRAAGTFALGLAGLAAVTLVSVWIGFDWALAGLLYLIVITTRLVSRATQAARQAEARARLLDLTYDSVAAFDRDRRITYWNRGAERLYGWNAAEALGRIGPDLLQAKVPRDALRVA
jgi:PAS domain-containing protein